MAYSGGNPNGLTTSANSAPVVIASDNVVDTASNQVLGTGSITAADAASTSGSGQANQVLITGTPTANSVYALAIPNVNGAPESFSSVVINISGTFVGTYQFERSPDGGTTWTPFSPFVAGQPQALATGTLPGMFHGNIAGVTNIRVRCTAFTSGTINVRYSMGIGVGTITVGNPIRLYDMTNNTQAVIKPASTAPVATDTSIVTTEHPNSPLVTGTMKVKLANDVTNTTGSVTSATTTIATGALSGVGSVTVSIYGTYAGVNVTFEGSDSTGTNWVALPAQPIGTVTPTPVLSSGVLTSNGTFMWNIAPLLGLQYVRVRATAWTSGSASVIIAPSAQFTQPIVSIGSGTINAAATADGTVSGSLTSTASVTTATLNGASSATIQVTGTWAGVLTPEASIDGSTFVALSGTSVLNINTGAYSSTIGSGITGIFQVDVAAFNVFRVRMSTYTSGTAVVSIRTSTALGLVALDGPIPTGTNTIGGFGSIPTTNSAGLTITGTQSIQSLSSTVTLVKTGNSRLFEYDFYNPNTSGVWVQLFNAAAVGNVTLGTTAPIRTIFVPASAGRDWVSPYSLTFSAGICIACTTTNTGSTAPASAIQVYVGYV